MLYSIARFFFTIIFKVLFRFQVFGRSNFPRKGAFIVAANHLSYLDPILLGISSPRKLNFIAKDDLFKIKVFGFLISNVGAIPVKMDAKQNIGVFRSALSLLSKGNGFVIFPEGARSLNGKMQNMRAGVGFLAIKSQCPVIPVLIIGTEKALPLRAKCIRLKKITAYVGKALLPPLDSKGHGSFEEFSHRVEDSIRDLKRRVDNIGKLKYVKKRNKDF